MTLAETYACIPSTERGRGILISGDSKSDTMLYTNARSVVILDLNNPLKVSIYGEHAYPATVARYSPNGEWIASGDVSGTVRIWGARDDHVLKKEFKVLAGRIDDLQWSADGMRIVASGDGKGKSLVRAFMWDSGSNVGEFDGHSRRVLSCAFKPTRPFRIVTCGEDFLVNFYEGPPFKFKLSSREHSNFVNCVRYSPDGSKFITVSSDKKGVIYDGKTCEKLGELSSEDVHKGSIYAVSWSPDGKEVLTVSADKSAKVWEISDSGNGTLKTTLTCPGSSGGVDDMLVGCLWQNDHIVTVSLGGTISIFSASDLDKSPFQFSGHMKNISSLSVLRGSSDYILSGSYDGLICKWMMGRGFCGKLQRKQNSQIKCFAAHEEEIITSGFDNTISRISYQDGQCTNEESIGVGNQPNDLSLAPLSPGLLLVAFESGVVFLRGEKVVSTINLGFTVTALAVTPDGTEAIVGGQDGKLHLYSVNGDSLTEEAILERHRGAISVIRYSPDLSMFASADLNREAVVWDRASREMKLKNMLYHSARINCLAWSPNSSMVATGSLDTCVIVYEVDKPASTRMTIKGAHLGGVYGLGFADDTHVVSSGEDACIRVSLNMTDIDIEEIEAAGEVDLRDLGEPFLQSFCKKAATSFFDEYGLVSHQLNSYNFFIEHGLQSVFESSGEMLVEPSFDPTKNKDHGGDTPRLQNMTYSARMKVFVKKVVKRDKFKAGQDEYVEKQILSKKTQDIPIGRIPVMVKSVLCNTTEKGKNGESYRKGECAFDQGGYFVIKGAEKVFIAQEQICTKRLWISNSPWTVSYRSETKRNRFIVRLSENQKAEDFKRKEKVLTVYFLSTEIPVWVLFFALGVASDKEAVDLIAFDGGDASITNSVVASIQEADSVCEDFRHGRNALAYVEQQIKGTKFPPGESVDECLSLYLFPGLKSLKQKARFLGYMVKCLFSAYAGKRKCENRDNFRNKRIELAGELLERELRVHLAHARRTMTKAMQRHLTGDGDLKPIEHYLDASIITNGLSRAFSTGAWCHPFRKMERVSGVVANLGRANPLQSLIDLRRTRQQVLYTGRVGDARYPHPSHWGRVCFLSTPDGENCGLVKNLSLLGLVSTQIMEPVVEELFDSGMEELVDDTSTPLSEKHKVLLNGDWVGVCSDSDYFVAELKSRRRQSELPRQMEIKLDKDDKEVRIFTDAGRLLRPLLVVENLHKLKQSKPSKYTFQHLLDQGILELIGIEEEEDCTTAWGTKQLLKQQKSYTHCELDLSFLLGVSCAIVPFANHDHGRRVLYQSQKHCQQAIGFCSTNPNIRCDTLSQQLFYPQRPLFKTMASECLQKDVLFNGQNAIVAVNVHLGFNQEDSIVMNKASLERGMFRSEQIRSYKADVDSKDSEKRKKMDEVVQFGKTHSKIGRVDSLDDDGFPFVGANMHSGDIVIGRCTESGTDHSVKLKHTERGIVQKVVLSSNDDGKNYATVSLRQVRSPCLGDKFSIPDIVINPHAFPSRQTLGQLLEAALSKGIACPMQKKKGKSDAYSKVTRHATPFSTPSVDDITDQLHRAGFSRSGNERVYNGRTGEMMRSLIFMGPNFYQRLIHMSEDKVKFRNTGPVHPLTPQPVADRKRFGGIKFGEMERDCLIAHGASANLHERLFTLSDSSQMHICRNCKSAANVIERVASSERRIRGPYCRLCESPDYVVMVNVPYGAKLLYQELFSIGICLNFETNLC
ncbi:hypothetical protein Bca101_073028 [Brassica carinata]